MKFRALGIGLIIYLIVYSLVYYGYINYFAIDVVFYSAIYAAALSLVIFILILRYFKLFKILSFFEKFNMVIIGGLLGYVVAISLPTVIDRSLSFYILEKLKQRGGAIQLSKFDYIFTNEYMREHKLVDIRLTEQSQSGTIIIDGDCVRLTSKGSWLANFSHFFRKNFLPKKRLLRGEYTDTLIDPFSRSDIAPDYLCK
jgi:hypothetical protein